MTPEILAAVIQTAGGFVTGAAGPTIGWVRERRRRQKAEANPASVHEQLVSMYGFKARSCTTKAKILDPKTGDVEFVREWCDVEVVDDQPLSHLCHRSESTGTANPAATLQESAGSDSKIQIRGKYRAKGGGVETTIEFEPSLRKGRRVSYSLRTRSDGALLVDAQAIAAAYKDQEFQREYFAGRVQFPTEELIVEVEFPHGYTNKSTPTIFLPRMEIPAPREFVAAARGFETITTGARWRIEHPLIEFGYAICWFGRDGDRG